MNKPPLATLMPNVKMNKSLLLDVGAVVDCKPRNIYEFAIMGRAYAQEVMGVNKPKIGLLSNGEEDSKGNELAKESFPLLKKIDGLLEMLRGVIYLWLC